MSVRNKYHIYLWVIWPSIGILLGFAMLYVSHYFAILFLAFPAYIEIVTARIRCPSCGSRIGWRTYNILRFKFKWWEIGDVPNKYNLTIF
jgi:hypothetical protein